MSNIGLNQLAEWLGGQRLEGNDGEQKLTTIVATATAASADGRVKVVLTDDVISVEDANGNFTGTTEVEIPTSAHVEEGDQVVITMFGGAMSKPIYTQVQGGGDRTYTVASLAQDAADEAAEIAGEAAEAIEAVNQHFFADENGIHVSTVEGDPTTGPNLLANSVGILLRDGTIIRTAQTPSGFAVYDGIGNQAGNIIALLGDVITLGKTGEPQLVLDNDGFEALNQNGNIFFHVGYSDEAYDAQGHQQYLPFLLFGEDGSLVSRRVGGYSVAVGYGTEARAYASFAAGKENEASGYCSAALGDKTKATAHGALSCGYLNDASSDTLFSVGDGYMPTSSTYKRENAFEVKTDGRLYTKHGEVWAAAVLYESFTVDLTTTNFDLSAGLSAAGLSMDVLKRLEIFYYDNLGNKGSVAVWDPKNNDQVLATTTAANFTASAFVVRSRLFQISGSYIYALPGWSCEYSYSTQAQGGALSTGDFIGIQAIIGYY